MSKQFSQPHQEFQSFVSQFVQLVGGKQYSEAISLVQSTDKSFLGMPFESNNQNNTLLHACRHGILDLVKAILDIDPDLQTSQNKHQNTPLHEAALNPNLTIADFLLEPNDKLIAQKNATGHIPLHFAAMSNNTPLVKFFLSQMTKDQVAIVTTKDCYNALHLAVHSGNAENVRMIIEANPDLISSVDANGRLPLHHAVRANGNTEIPDILLAEQYKPKEQITAQAGGDNDYTPVHFAAASNNVPALELMLQICPEASKISGSNGHNPLHAAAASKQECTSAGMFLCRIMEKADINAPDKQQKTPFMLAFATKKSGLATFLEGFSGLKDSLSQLQESRLSLEKSAFSHDDIQSAVKNLHHAPLLLEATSHGLFEEGRIEEAYKCYKTAKRLAESKLQSQKLMEPRFSDCSGQYPPFLVKESLEAVLDISYVIEFANDAWSRNLPSRIESYIKQIEQNKKVLLLLTDDKMTLCDRAIKLEKKSEDECNFIYINPLGTSHAMDTTAKTILQHLTAKTEDAVTIFDLKSPHASEGNKIGIYIIEDIIRLAKLDASASRLALVKALPTSDNFDPEKAEKKMEWGRDTNPFYSTEKMSLLAPLVFTDMETKFFTPVLLTKQTVLDNFQEAIGYVTNHNKPSALLVYDATEKNWSGLAIKKNAETGNITLFFSDPKKHLEKFIGGVSKIMIQHSQGCNIVKATENYEKTWDSGPATLGNLCKFICTDPNLLSSSRLGAILKYSIDETRAEHIALLQKSGINVPPLEKVNFSDQPTSYMYAFMPDSQFEQEIVSLEEGRGASQKILGEGSHSDGYTIC